MSASEYKYRMWREFWFNFYHDLLPKSKWTHTIECKINVSPEDIEKFNKMLG